MEVVVIDDAAEFQALRKEHQALFEHERSPNLYLSWEWLWTWWQHYGDTRQLRLVTVRADGELVGVLPLCQREVSYFGRLPFRRLELIATGEARHEEVCPAFMGLLARRRDRTSIARAALSPFFEAPLSQSWDELVLRPLPEAASTIALFEALESLSGAGWLVEREVEANRSAVTRLPRTFGELLGRFGSKTRKRLRSGIRQLRNRGCRFEWVQTPAQYDSFISEFAEQHRSKWKRRSPFSSRRFDGFHKAVGARFMERGWDSFSRIVMPDGRPIAMNLDYRCHGRVYGYQTTFDPTYDPKLSIGLIGMAMCLEKAIELGDTSYDWYREGPVDGYKRHLGLELRNVMCLRAARPSARELLRRAATLAGRGARGVRQGIRALGRDGKASARLSQGDETS